MVEVCACVVKRGGRGVACFCGAFDGPYGPNPDLTLPTTCLQPLALHPPLPYFMYLLTHHFRFQLAPSHASRSSVVSVRMWALVWLLAHTALCAATWTPDQSKILHLDEFCSSDGNGTICMLPGGPSPSFLKAYVLPEGDKLPVDASGLGTTVAGNATNVTSISLGGSTAPVVVQGVWSGNHFMPIAASLVGTRFSVQAHASPCG